MGWALDQFSDVHASGVTFNVFEVSNPRASPRPDELYYNSFYNTYNLHFVKEVPPVAFDHVASADFFTLGASLSDGFAKNMNAKMQPRSRSIVPESLLETTSQRTVKPDSTKEELAFAALQHRGLGFILRDVNGMELRRISASYWACDAGAADVPHVTSSGKLGFFNRAIVAYALSKGDWEGGYWTSVEHVKKLNTNDLRKAWLEIQKFASQYPYNMGFEAWSSSGAIISSSITCNTFVQTIVWNVAKRDIYKEGIIPIFYMAAVFDLKKNVLLEQKERSMPCFPMPFMWPIWYEHGALLNVTDEWPRHVRIHVPLAHHWRSNFQSLTEYTHPLMAGECARLVA